MSRISAIVLFADDIREEKDGRHSIMGIFGDNVLVPSFPGALSKLGMYVRIHIPADMEVPHLKLFITMPDGTRSIVNDVSKEIIDKSLTDAKRDKNRIASIYSVLISSPFGISGAGRISIELDAGSETIYLGSLNIVHDGQGLEKS